MEEEAAAHRICGTGGEHTLLSHERVSDAVEVLNDERVVHRAARWIEALRV